MSALLSTADAAALLGLATGSFTNNVQAWNLTPAERRGRVNLYRAADIDRIARQRAAAKAAPRAAITRKPQPAEQANAKMERDLERAEGFGLSRAGDSFVGLPTDREMAVVWAAFVQGTLGPASRWSEAHPPPTSYRLAFERFRPESQDDEVAHRETVAA